MNPGQSNASATQPTVPAGVASPSLSPIATRAVICPETASGSKTLAVNPCCAGVCPTHTPLPTPTPSPYGNTVGYSYRSIESATSSSYDIILRPGQTGTISFQCRLIDIYTGAYAACDGGTTDQWVIDSAFGGGITEAFNPSSTVGTQYTALTITPSLATQPGVFTTSIQADITATDQQVSQPNSAILTLTLDVVQPSPTSAPTPFNSAIAYQSQLAFNAQESTAAGPACTTGEYTQPGSCACAWEVNRILNRAGVSSIGSNPDYVPSMETALIANRGTLVSLAAALPGDLDIENSQSHIGICMTVMCTLVYSNSTKHSEYIDPTGPDIFESLPPRIYRVEN